MEKRFVYTGANFRAAVNSVLPQFFLFPGHSVLGGLHKQYISLIHLICIEYLISNKFCETCVFLARKTYCTGSMILKSDTHPDLAFELLLISDCYAQLRLLDLGRQLRCS